MLARAHDADHDTGPGRGEAGTERFCIATRTVKPVGDLIRFVVGPDGDVVPDLKQKLPGRGVWVTGERAALAEAIRRKAFAKGFKRQVRAEPALVEMTERLLARAALDALAIAGKAGEVVTGFTKVEAALERSRVAGVVHAAEARADGVRKVEAALRRRFGAAADQIPVVAAFTSAQLDLALGRSNVIHAALLAGPASPTFLARCLRHERFRAGDWGNRRHSVAVETGCPEDRDRNE